MYRELVERRELSAVHTSKADWLFCKEKTIRYMKGVFVCEEDCDFLVLEEMLLMEILIGRQLEGLTEGIGMRYRNWNAMDGKSRRECKSICNQLTPMYI